MRELGLLLRSGYALSFRAVETLRATSQFGYVRDACNVSVWIVCGYVGDVARYVSTGWWNRDRPDRTMSA